VNRKQLHVGELRTSFIELFYTFEIQGVAKISNGAVQPERIQVVVVVVLVVLVVLVVVPPE
jgi:hypothetical protein